MQVNPEIIFVILISLVLSSCSAPTNKNDFDLEKIAREQEKSTEALTDSMFNVLNDEAFEQDTITH